MNSNISAPVLGLAVLGFATLTLPANAAVQTQMAAQWRPQQLEFTYSGFTSFYTCEGIEDKVREVLLVFGARKDAVVRATGCERGGNRPSGFAWVRTEFNSLSPVDDSADAAAVKSAWAKVRIAPRRPTDMGAGECELMEQMRELLQKGFQIRNAEFRTSCVPKQFSLLDYDVTAEVLKPVAQ